jgi:cytochrome oxidase Cu insertion factor (SCO1/SenC/PrrC family)
MHKSGLTGNWHWLMGTKKQLSPVWKAWGTYVNPTPQDILHTDAVYLIDQKGFVRVADAVPFQTKLLAESVRALEKAF